MSEIKRRINPPGASPASNNLGEAVHREVMEETGLTIKNLKYFGSQPWPYPSGLMIGISAEYVDGEIHLQKEEQLQNSLDRVKLQKHVYELCRVQKLTINEVRK